MTENELESYCRGLAERAREASRRLAGLSGKKKIDALLGLARLLREESGEITAANAEDVAAAKKAGQPTAMIDRLTLTPKRLEGMAESAEQIAAQPDPIGQTLSGSIRPNGLDVRKVRVPLGVILFIYEARPNVTADAACLALWSGNALILRGGKQALRSNQAITGLVRRAFSDAGVDPDATGIVETTDRAAVNCLLKLDELIDLVVPRGGESLIRTVVENSRIPVIKHYTGNCHVYVDASAKADPAVPIVLNAKCQRPGVCNAMETLLVHRAHAQQGGLLERMLKDLIAAGVELRGCPTTCSLSSSVKPAEEEDWRREYLNLILAVRVVDDLDQAVAHINTYGSAHTEAIVTSELSAARRFTVEVDSASVMVNTSTRFSDGGEYGLGAEMGISTDKLHARGPMGAADLTTYKWVVRGDGQLRG